MGRHLWAEPLVHRLNTMLGVNKVFVRDKDRISETGKPTELSKDLRVGFGPFRMGEWSQDPHATKMKEC